MQSVLKLFLTLLLLQAGVLTPAFAHGDDIAVMTQNQYLGADLTPIVTAPNAAVFNQAVLAALEQIKANNFPERARALAEEIIDRRPEVVGLQEVFSFKRNGQQGAPPYRDHLADTLSALENFGARYVVAASVRNLHLTLPVHFPGDGILGSTVMVTDRDVILVRADIAATAVPFAQFCLRPSQDGGPGCNYQTIAQANTVVGAINIERGFVGVDVTLAGKTYRVVNTHLEVQEPDPTNPLSPAVQAAQMKELLTVLAASTPQNTSLIILGDINSAPEDQTRVVGELTIVPPYQQLVLAGYNDAWTLRRRETPGFTCCQLADLSNPRSMLDERIDVIFTAEEPKKVRARVLGARAWEKTYPSQLWPSDHAAVVAELKFEKEQVE